MNIERAMKKHEELYLRRGYSKSKRQEYLAIDRVEEMIKHLCRIRGWELSNFDGRKHFYGSPNEKYTIRKKRFLDILHRDDAPRAIDYLELHTDTVLSTPKIVIEVFNHFGQLANAKELQRLLEENNCIVEILSRD